MDRQGCGGWGQQTATAITEGICNMVKENRRGGVCSWSSTVHDHPDQLCKERKSNIRVRNYYCFKVGTCSNYSIWSWANLIQLWWVLAGRCCTCELISHHSIHSLEEGRRVEEEFDHLYLLLNQTIWIWPRSRIQKESVREAILWCLLSSTWEADRKRDDGRS